MGKKIAQNKLLYSILLLALALVTTVSVIFGWFVMGDPNADDFIVSVSGSSVEVGLKINNENHGGGNLVLENAMPNTEYVFEVSITPDDNGNVKVSFYNPTGSFYDEEYDESGDMCDVMAIRYPKTSSEYTRVSELENNIIVSDIPVTTGETTNIEFMLFFSNSPPSGEDINIYQGKTFTIEKLLIELY